MNSVINVCGKEIRVQGRMVRIARLEADLYHFLEDPEPMLEALRNCGTRIDLFTFMQRLPETSPKYHYPMERDNLAAMPITTFEEWWKETINNKTRNMVRRAEKNGVTLREVPLNDELARGMWEATRPRSAREERTATTAKMSKPCTARRRPFWTAASSLGHTLKAISLGS